MIRKTRRFGGGWSRAERRGRLRRGAVDLSVRVALRDAEMSRTPEVLQDVAAMRSWLQLHVEVFGCKMRQPSGRISDALILL